jgi:hypothetical protein
MKEIIHDVGCGPWPVLLKLCLMPKGRQSRFQLSCIEIIHSPNIVLENKSGLKSLFTMEMPLDWWVILFTIIDSPGGLRTM